MNGSQPTLLETLKSNFLPSHHPRFASTLFADGRMADIISCFWAGDVAFSILKKCLNPNHPHELLLLEESK